MMPNFSHITIIILKFDFTILTLRTPIIFLHILLIISILWFVTILLIEIINNIHQIIEILTKFTHTCRGASFMELNTTTHVAVVEKGRGERGMRYQIGTYNARLMNL